MGPNGLLSPSIANTSYHSHVVYSTAISNRTSRDSRVLTGIRILHRGVEIEPRLIFPGRMH